MNKVVFGWVIGMLLIFCKKGFFVLYFSAWVGDFGFL